MSNDDFELVRGSGNVFRDQGEPDADVKQAKALLAAQIIGALEDQALSVRKAAGLTGFAAADFSRVRNAELGRFSIDRLIKMLAALDEGIEVSIQFTERPTAQRQNASL
jgi:predicted XRE-type DNA-binding protein